MRISIGYNIYCRVTRFVRVMPYPIRLAYWTLLYHYNRRKYPDGEFTLNLYLSYAE